MFYRSFRRHVATTVVIALASATAFGQDAAQSDAPPPLADNPLFNTSGSSASMAAPAPAASPAHKVTINLLNLMVKKNLLSADEAQDLIKEAQAEADADTAQANARPQPPGPNDTPVMYVPEIVKDQLRDEIKDSLLSDKTFVDQNLAGRAGVFPDWISRWEPFGDIRLRFEYDSFPKGNDSSGAFPNFNVINTGSPYDISGTQFSPQYNTDQNRERLRLRLRLGTDINLDDGFSAGVRLGTGESNSPVSSNQSLGVANQGQGGNFSKYAIWLDRAFLKYERGGQPDDNLTLVFGRFDNPFISTTVIWSDDIGFDGLAFKGRHEVADGVVPFFTGGLFPVFNTDLNFSSTSPTKFKSTDKWLYAAQAGVDWKITKDIQWKNSVAYYHFEGVEGKLSTPFTPLTPQDQGNTDDTRPSFAQKGNTYRALRQIIPSALNNFGATNQYQYFGLATPFHELAYDFQLDLNAFEPAQISLVGEYVNNLAFDRNKINGYAVNNRGPSGTNGAVGAFAGDNTAWNIALRVGKAKFEKAGDWQASVGYRYVGSDSVVDGFNDQDFGGGGTNVEGFTIGAAVALSPRVKLSLRWMSANEIAGPAFKSDIVQFDLQAKF